MRCRYGFAGGGPVLRMPLPGELAILHGEKYCCSALALFSAPSVVNRCFRELFRFTRPGFVLYVSVVMCVVCSPRCWRSLVVVVVVVVKRIADPRTPCL